MGKWWTRPVVVAVTALGVLLLAVGVAAAAKHYRRSSRPDAEEHEAVQVAPNSSTGSCGVERWSVKTGTDADASAITLQSTTSTTIAALDAIPAPATLPSNNRVKPTETTVYRVAATLTEYKLEADSDYHLVLSDGAGHTMIAEIPDPACVGASSPLLTSIQKARGEFDAKYNATGSFQTANSPVTVTGVGFFDFQHGQTGVAPNGIELHAVLDIAFGAAPSPSPTPTTTTPAPTPTTTSPSPTPTTSSTPTGCSGQLLGNPGFETGTAPPWTASTGVISNSSSEPPHTGAWDAWLDGYGTTHTDTVSQAVTIPAGCAATLTFWLHIDTAEPSSTSAYDTLTVKVGSTTLATYSNKNAATGYSEHSLSISGYAGRTVTLTFTGTEDYAYQTSFILDDTAVTLG